ncbi:hypothetical protein FACS189472_12770 [Alphaproteobacteria bacterium]|nr:hypothetical protein FACS189472_12770 [Alphaproteobacteria bacterium]
MIRYFITTSLKTMLPTWWVYHNGPKNLTVLTVHYIPEIPPKEEVVEEEDTEDPERSRKQTDAVKWDPLTAKPALTTHDPLLYEAQEKEIEDRTVEGMKMTFWYPYVNSERPFNGLLTALCLGGCVPDLIQEIAWIFDTDLHWSQYCLAHELRCNIDLVKNFVGNTWDLPAYLTAYAISFLIENTGYFDKIKRVELTGIAGTLGSQLASEFGSVKNFDLRTTLREIAWIKSQRNPDFAGKVATPLDLVRKEVEPSIYQHPRAYQFDRFRPYITEGIRICLDNEYDIEKFKPKIDENKLAELALGYFESMEEELTEQNLSKFRDCKRALALVFQSVLELDLGYEAKEETGQLGYFKTSRWIYDPGEGKAMVVLKPYEKYKFDEAIKPWVVSDAIYTGLSVWDLNLMCKRIARSFVTDNIEKFLLFNVEGNIWEALDYYYGQRSGTISTNRPIKIRRGVLGYNSPIVDVMIYKSFVSNKMNESVWNKDMWDNMVYGSNNESIFPTAWDIFNCTDRVISEVNDLYRVFDNREMMKKVVLKAMTVLNGGEAPTIVDNDNVDSAKVVGDMVVKSQEALMKTLTKGLHDGVASGNTQSTEQKKQMTTTSVHSNLAVLNSDYSQISSLTPDKFIMYANETAYPKKFQIPPGMELNEVEFWLKNLDGSLVTAEKIKSIRVELVLEVERIKKGITE